MEKMLEPKKQENKYYKKAEEIFKEVGMKPSKETLEAVANCLSRYKEENIVYSLSMALEDIVYKTKNEKAVSDAARWLSSDVVFDCILKYKNTPEVAEKIAYYQLGRTAYYAKTEQEVLDAARWLSSDVVFDCILKYKNTPEVASFIASQLESIAENTKSKEAISAAAACISKYKKIPEAAEEIASLLADISWNKKNEQEVLDTAKLLSSDDVLDCVSRFDKTPEIARKIVRMLGSIAENTKSKEAVSDAAACISKYKKIPEVANEIAFWLGEISWSKNRQAVSDAAKLLSSDDILNYLLRYEKIPAPAKEIASWLGDIALNTKSKEAILESIHLITTYQDPRVVKEILILLGAMGGTTKDEKEILEKINDVKMNIQKIRSYLYKNYNIQHFGRYPWEVLKHMYEDKERISDRPVAILGYARADWNGSFYQNQFISEIAKYYDVRIFEAETDKEYAEMLKRMVQKYGKASLLVISGHGEPTKVWLGEWNDPSSFFDVSDDNVLNQIGESMEPGGQIIFNSCSTGDPSVNRSIAAVVAEAAKATKVFAPDTPAGTPYITIELNNGKPEVKEVKYSGGAKEMTYRSK